MIWTEEEVLAARKTKELLMNLKGFDHNFLSDREIFLTTMNCKLRPEKAADKFMKWTNEMKDLFKIHSFDEIYSGVFADGQGTAEAWEAMSPLFNAYAGTGKDKQGRGIMWIRARSTPVDEERLSVRAGVIYWVATHADVHSMRQGITFVIDTTHRDMQQVNGNEKKLQRVYQSIPLRPQSIFILGANFFKRLLINSVIAFASLFTSDKVIDRVRFASLEEVVEEISEENLPVYIGGNCKGGGISDNTILVAEIRERLRQFPAVPAL